ncbi:MAG: hypothetical protein AAF804_15205, partial [Bacteroidota bacterium]
EKTDLPLILALPQGSQAGTLVGIPGLADSSLSKITHGIPTYDSLLIGSPMNLFPEDSTWFRTEHLRLWLIPPEGYKSLPEKGL